MSDDKPIYLVVGADSLIGRALFQQLLDAGEIAAGTTRRHGQTDPRFLYLDLLEAPETWEPPPSAKVAIICAGITRLHACESEAEMSARVNVEGVTALVKNFANRGLFVIYLSTNQVFDGSKPLRAAGDPLSPQTEYGRQKAEAERRVMSSGDATAIVRFTKVLEPHPLLFSTWIEAMRQGNTIHPFSDMFMAPVPLTLAGQALHSIARAKSTGLFQMSAAQDISYEQVARRLAERLALSENLIAPIRTSESGLAVGSIPLHTTLDASRIENEFGIAPPNPWSTVESVLK